MPLPAAGPYSVPSDLPGTSYRLEELLGLGGFGAVYRASDPRLQHLPFAVKFCLDPDYAAALHRERKHLERLLASASADGARNIVRLYGYDLDHPTPFLVYEFVPGGDLLRAVQRRRAAADRPPSPDLVLAWVRQIVAGLACAHRLGLVHRDLKPANVLLDGDTLKLGDFGLGGQAPDLAGPTTSVSQFRGAGTPLYMSPEQKRGDPPDPRHDLYSLGVLWFQLLLGDTNIEITPGWERELLALPGVPRFQIEQIARCVGPIEERPADAAALLMVLPQTAVGPRAATRSCPNCGEPALPNERSCKACFHRLDGSGPSPALDDITTCPSCKAAFPPKTFVCLRCRFDRRTGSRPNALNIDAGPPPTDAEVPVAVAAYGFLYRVVFKVVAILGLIAAALGLFQLLSTGPPWLLIGGPPAAVVSLLLTRVGQSLELGRRWAVYATAALGVALAAGGFFVLRDVVLVVYLGGVLLLFVPPVVLAGLNWRAFQ